MEFTEINYSAEVPDDLFVSSGKELAQAEMTPAEAGKIVGVKVTLPKYLPAGYELDGATIHKCECECGHNAAHLRYTDGMNSLSVFETQIQPACNGPTCKVHCPAAGACEVSNAEQAQVATASSGGKAIVVVADLPKDEIERVAKSIP
jgi:negative regulator of sigma E activity